jgi:two-component system CheB/CheR fusion protein
MPGIKYLVGIGGSAGALEEYIGFLKALPAASGMAFVFVAHLNPNVESNLAKILSRHTRMPITELSKGIRVKVDHVYVIAPNTDLTFNDQVFEVSSPRTVEKGRHKQIDVFLTSLSKTFGKRAIGIIFSGVSGDGTEGCKHIKKRGGLTFAQHPTTEFNSMPLSAFKSGCVDFVLTPDEIAKKLVCIAAGLPAKKPLDSN